MSDKEAARLLYRPKKGVEEVVAKMCDLFDKSSCNGVRFDSTFKLGGTSVKFVEREHSHSAILVHWEPDFRVSTTSDPFCSAYILTLREANKLYKELEKNISNQ
jgi:hypothetical protein